MVELWLIRHGQTDWNVEGRYQGQADIPLNANGLRQATELAGRLNGAPFDAIFSSDLLRTRQTAEALAEHCQLDVQLDVRLREIHQGEWEGKLVKDMIAAHPKARAEFLQDPFAARAPGGESVGEVAVRVRAAVEEIAAAYPQGRVLVISHGLSIATLLCAVRGVDLTNVYDLIPDNASPSIVTWPPAEL